MGRRKPHRNYRGRPPGSTAADAEEVWHGIVTGITDSHTLALGSGHVIPPVLMAVRGGELLGAAWLRPVHRGLDAIAGISEMSMLPAAAHADEVILAWEQQDVAVACELPVDPDPCLNILRARHDGYLLHPHPYDAILLSQGTGRPVLEPRWHTPPPPLRDAVLPPGIRAVTTWSFPSARRDHDPLTLDAAVLYMRAQGYSVDLR